MWLKLCFQVSKRTRLLVLLTFMGVRIWHWSDSWLLERKQQLFSFSFFSWKFAFAVRKIQWSFCGIFVCCDFKVTKGMNEAVLRGSARGRTGVLCPALKEEEQRLGRRVTPERTALWVLAWIRDLAHVKMDIFNMIHWTDHLGVN